VWDHDQGLRLVTGSMDQCVRVFEVSTRERLSLYDSGVGKVHAIFAGTLSSVPTVAWGGDGEDVVVLPEGNDRIVLPGHKATDDDPHRRGVRSIVGSPTNSEVLYVGGDDGRVRRWSVPTKVCQTMDQQHEDAVLNVASFKCPSGGDAVVSVGRDGRAYIHDTGLGLRLLETSDANTPHTRLARDKWLKGIEVIHHRDRTLVAIGGKRGLVWIFEPDCSVSPIAVLNSGAGIRSLKLVTAGTERFLAAGSEDGSARIHPIDYLLKESIK
jgi:WD40 repeat protein